MGNVVTAGEGQAPARQAAVNGGLPATIPAVTINKVCGSGLKAVMLAAQAIRAGDAQLVVAGGMESMSNVPHYVRGLRNGVKFGDQTLQDGLIHDGLWCSFGNCHMGGHAEYTAAKAGVTRDDADAFSLRSHQKAVAAIESGRFRTRSSRSRSKAGAGVTVVDTDESPRGDTSLEALGKLRPAFVKDAPEDIAGARGHGGQRAGAERWRGRAGGRLAGVRRGARPRAIDAVITGYAAGATEPRDLFFAPIDAVQKLMAKEGKAIGDYGLFEVNEAFAVQAIADMRGLGMDEERVNVNGGAVALGHPIGASGTRILVTLLNAMEQKGAASGAGHALPRGRKRGRPLGREGLTPARHERRTLGATGADSKR